MKVIIIAAGSSTRLAKETLDIPKGMLKINDKSIIEIQLDLFKKNQLSDITIITGPDKQKFELKNVNYIQDYEFQNHDVLGSLLAARSIMNDDILISYSDIIFDKNILQSMLDFKGDIGIAVDLNWEKNYVNRTQHPKSEADNVLMKKNKILKIKKNMIDHYSKHNLGEFVGLMKLSKNGAKVFIEKFNDLTKFHRGKFHDAASIKKAYLTDMIQELVDSGFSVEPVIINGKWYEIDTPEDLERVRKNIQKFEIDL
jgi:phosphoenolpyruvate phosphomutase